MPAVKPGSGDAGLIVQTVKLAVAPATPYILTEVVALTPQTDPQLLAVRSLEDGGGAPLDWFYTETTRTARIAGIDYLEIKARITSGTATSLKIDRLDTPHHAAIPLSRVNSQGVATTVPGSFINSSAWALLNTPDALRLEFIRTFPGGGTETRVVSLTGGFGSEQEFEADLGSGDIQALRLPANRIFSAPLRGSGWFRWGRIIRTLYKHVPVMPGGSMGYLHIFGTVMADTPEIQWEISWHNGGIEERVAGGPSVLGDPTNLGTPADPFGNARCQDALFSRVRIRGFVDIDAAPGFAGAWIWTPQLQDGGSGPADSVMRPSQNELIKPVSDTDADRQHVLPITFERPFRFAVHPSSVTPYLKHATGMADWSKDLGGFGFMPLGLPDYTALGAAAAAMTMATYAATAKTRLRMLQPYKSDNSTDNGTGLVPVSPLWPGSWDEYGGSTSGTGMWPFFGCKPAWTAQKEGLELLRVEQLRSRARTYGALYYNISGIPCTPIRHAPGGVAPWERFNRRFLKGSSGPKDSPFGVTRAARAMHLADYNCGPRGGIQSADTPLENPQGSDVNRPDWYLPGENVPGVAMDTLAVGPLTLVNFDQGLGYVPLPPGLTNLPGLPTADLAVPVLIQLNGATTYDNTKTVVYRVTGTGELDILATEDVTFTGPASGATYQQARQTQGKFKLVVSIEIVSITGTLLATELLSIGRASVGIADYFGDNAITALDDQHAVRYHACNKALFLLANDPMAFIYLMMDAHDARMTYWELQGAAKRIGTIDNGSLGHGNNLSRNHAFAIDRIATGIALSEALVPHAVVDAVWDTWRQTIRANLFNSRMSANGLFQAPNAFKEWSFQPFSNSFTDLDGGTTSKFFHGVATRETAYFLPALLQLSVIYGHDDPELRDLIKGMAVGFQNLLWKVSGSTTQGPHAYMPVALRREAALSPNPRTGALENRVKMTSEPVGAADLWTVYGSQAELPEENPLSKCLLAPASYPPVDDDLYVAALAGNAAALGAGSPTGSMAALTLLRNDANAAQQPTPIELKVLGGSTFNSSKRRTFKVTGTDPWGVPLDDDCLVAERLGDTIFPGTAFTILGHSFPVAAQLTFTVLGGSTFVHNTGTGEGRMVLAITGTSISGSPLTENLNCLGQGTPKQTFKTGSYFKTVTSVVPTQVSGIGGSFNRPATEKYRMGTAQPYLLAVGNGGPTQTFRLWANCKTVTEIIMLTQTQATDHGFTNTGTLVVGETFRFGTPAVGLRTSLAGGGPLDSDGYQTAYGLAVLKYLNAPEADELIKRHANVDGSQGGADTLLAAKDAIKAWNEFTGGPAGRLEQWAPLLQTLRAVV